MRAGLYAALRAVYGEPDSSRHAIGNKGRAVWVNHPVLARCPHGGADSEADHPAARAARTAKTAIFGRMPPHQEGLFRSRLSDPIFKALPQSTQPTHRNRFSPSS